MNQSAYQALQAELESGERLYWADQPVQGLRITRKDIPLIPFSIFWLGFSLVWEYMAYTMGAPFFFMLFGLPFVLLGVQMLVGRFVVDAMLRARTFYGLTNKRVLILSGLKKPQLSYYDLEDLDDFYLDEQQDGSGQIEFDHEPVMMGNKKPSMLPRFGPRYDSSFQGISNARLVYDQIQSRQRMAR